MDNLPPNFYSFESSHYPDCEMQVEGDDCICEELESIQNVEEEDVFEGNEIIA